MSAPRRASTRLALAVAGLLLGGGGLRPAVAAGSICRQDCSKGVCAQTLCGSAGTESGYCRCSGGSQEWDATTHSSWCTSWGQPLASCAAATPQTGADGQPMASRPALAIPRLDVMSGSLRSANPWVATLIRALHDGTHWLDGPAQGLIHDSYFDAETRRVGHNAALPFTAQVTSDSLGAVQIDIRVTGDVAQLSRLQRYAEGASPAALLPRRVTGAISEGGLHGSLAVLADDGRTQAIRW